MPVLFVSARSASPGKTSATATRSSARAGVVQLKIELAGLSEAERRAYILADNRLALNAGWDQDLLASEVAGLDGLGVDLSLAGFAESELGTLLDHFRAGLTLADEALPRQRTPSVVRATSGAWVSTGCCAAMH